VPSIIISSDPPHIAHSSPTTPGSYSSPASPNYSLDAHYDSSLIGDNLSILPNSSLSSPLEYDNRSSHSGGLSPYSPTPSASPTSRQNWQLIDGNMEMPFDISESLVALMSHSVWSSKFFFYNESKCMIY
jgi:hypothetical protein